MSRTCNAAQVLLSDLSVDGERTSLLHGIDLQLISAAAPITDAQYDWRLLRARKQTANASDINSCAQAALTRSDATRNATE